MIDFGFASQLGSGVYSMSGRTLQVYKLPFGYEFDHAADARVRPRLTLPVTLGFLDFEPVDVVHTGLPESLDSLSFVPGLVLEVMLSPRWRLEPFVEAGIARDRTSDLDQRIYAAGLRSLYDLTARGTSWQLYDELLYTSVDQRSLDRSDDFTRLRLGVTARRPFDVAGYGRRADYLVYGFSDLFVDKPDSPLNGEERRAKRRALRARRHLRGNRAAAAVAHSSAADRARLSLRRRSLGLPARLRNAVLKRRTLDTS